MTKNELKKALINLLKEMGVTYGHVVFVQSNLLHFINAARIVTPKKLPELILDCLLEAVGDRGTVVMPSFTTDCARKGLPFDLYYTPSDSGSFVEHLRKMQGTLRSLHPVNSVIAFGFLAESITKNVSLGSYSWDSPFDRMASCDTIILCMGMTANLSNSFSHYAETRANLPYLYNKMLEYIPVSIDRVPIYKKFYMTVRYIDFDIVPDRSRHDKVMRQSGFMQFAQWGGGAFRAIKLKDYLNILMRQMKDDPFFLLSHPPVFRKNERPSDGCIIKPESSINNIKKIIYERI